MIRFCKFRNAIVLCLQVQGKLASMIFYLVDVQIIAANGPVVWGVAFCVGVGMRFCKVPING
jgi:hypothetical protein